MSEGPYNLLNEIESCKKTLESSRVMKEQYRNDITRLNERVRLIERTDYTPNRIPRITNMKASIGNLEFALKGICSNVRAMELRLQRLEAEKRDSCYYNETRNQTTQ